MSSEFEIKKFGKFFEEDVKNLGEEFYLKNFFSTNSFKYFKSFHYYDYSKNKHYRIEEGEKLIKYRVFRKSFDHCYIGKIKFTDMYHNYMKNFQKQNI